MTHPACQSFDIVVSNQIAMKTMYRSKTWIVVALLGLAAVLDGHAQQTGTWLELPDLHVAVPENDAVRLGTGQVTYLQIHLAQKTDQVAFARINTRINAVSANIVSTQRATDQGIVTSVDLKANPELALKPGRNSVEVSYQDRWNAMHYVSFLLDVPGSKAESPRTMPHAEVPIVGHHTRALVIGIARYKFGGRGIANLPFADSDAAAVRDFLVSQHGANIAAEDVHFLLNEDATIDAINGAVEALARASQPGDLSLVYLNMNGAYDPAAPDRKYLLAYDSDPDSMTGTAIPVSSLPDMLGAATDRHVVLLADTCHNAGIQTERKTTAKPDNLINIYLARAFALSGQSTIEASDARQFSQGGERWQNHGAFTYFLLKGLAGAADSNQDGTVTARELFRYVQLNVTKETADAQMPIYTEGHGGAMALAGLVTAHKH